MRKTTRDAMEKTSKEKAGNFNQWLGVFLEEKKWWIMPMLVMIILAILVVLYLLKYKNTNFIYSLF
jgi:hypothetical protein